MPKDAHEHVVAYEILLRLRHALSKKPSRTVSEQEFIVSTQNLVEKLMNEGRIEEARTALYAVLAQRKLVPTREEQARINACKDADTLRSWHAQAVVAKNVAEALMTTRGTAPRRSHRKSSARQNPAV